MSRCVVIMVGMFMGVQQAFGGMVGAIDFTTLVLPSTPNYYLACPAGFCQAQAHVESPVYAVNVDSLHQAWAVMIAKQPRVELVYVDQAARQFQYVQRSRVFRFPDYISVQFIPIDDTHATLAVFSRSRYGHSDLGVNKRRVTAWLQALESVLLPEKSNHINKIPQQ